VLAKWLRDRTPVERLDTFKKRIGSFGTEDRLRSGWGYIDIDR